MDHPCVCGEKVEIVAPLGAKAGSTPLVRGEAVSLQCEFFQLGITLACARRRYHNYIPSSESTHYRHQPHPVCFAFAESVHENVSEKLRVGDGQ